MIDTAISAEPVVHDVTTTATSRDAWVALGIGIPIVVAALFSLFSFWGEGNDVPLDSDYVELSAVLDKNWNPETDVLSALPAWSLRPFVSIRGKARVTGDGLTQAPLHRARRLWVVAEPDSEASVTTLTERFGNASIVWENPRLRLVRFDVTGPNVTHDLREDFTSATVSISAKKGDVACDPTPSSLRQAPNKRVFNCKGRKRWQRVTREIALVTENSSDVLYAHPPSRGETLRLHWPAARLGNAIVLRGGFFRSGANKARAPVTIRVSTVGDDGRDYAIGSLKVPVAFEFKAKKLAMPAAMANKTAPLTLSITTDDNASAAFGIDAYTISGAPGPADGPLLVDDGGAP